MYLLYVLYVSFCWRGEAKNLGFSRSLKRFQPTARRNGRWDFYFQMQTDQTSFQVKHLK